MSYQVRYDICLLRCICSFLNKCDMHIPIPVNLTINKVFLCYHLTIFYIHAVFQEHSNTTT